MMTKRAMLAEQEPGSAAILGTVEAEAIRLQLNRLVESPSFRSSKRCRLFLEHAIAHALTPNAEPLKERAVGMQVFGREPSYDTAADPVVRVTAGEIRRRLGQYYAEPAHQRELRVELPAGSYTPSFSWPADPALAAQPALSPSSSSSSFPPSSSSLASSGSSTSTAPSAHGGVAGAGTGNGAVSAVGAGFTATGMGEPGSPAGGRLAGEVAPRTWTRRMALGAGVVVLALLLGALVVARQPVSTFDRFWAPMVHSKVPVLLCTGSIDVYELPGRLKQASNLAAAAPAGQAAPAPLSIDPREVGRVGAGFVSVADAVAIVRFASLFQEHKTPYHVRENRSTSFADLRTSPAVLVGMFSNAWTLQLGSEFRFLPVRHADGLIVIQDRQRPDFAGWQVQSPWPALAISRDYALVSRVLDKATGTMVVIGAGITPYGTTAAAEFLTSPHHLDAALRQVPAEWANRNLQIVLETRVIDGSAAPPHVLATHVW